mgnify:FL=1
MFVKFESVVPMDDYTLLITMSNGNQMKFDISPYLDTVQFCPLKDKTVWKNIQVHDTYILWQGNTGVELDIATIMSYFA